MYPSACDSVSNVVTAFTEGECVEGECVEGECVDSVQSIQG